MAESHATISTLDIDSVTVNDPSMTVMQFDADASKSKGYAPEPPTFDSYTTNPGPESIN